MARHWKCLLCSFMCLFLSELLSHLNSVHHECDNFLQQCGLPNCGLQTEYTSPNSFVKHMRSHHWELLQSTFNAVFHGEEDLIELSNHEREEGYDGEEGDEAGTLKV